MKTLFISCLSCMLFTQSALCSNTPANNDDPGQLTKDRFYSDFGKVTLVGWERNKSFNEVTFIKDGKTISAFYDDEPSLIGTTETKLFADLPAKAQKKIQEEYRDYTIRDILLFDDNEQNQTPMELYNKTLEDEDNYFIELKKDNSLLIVESDLDGNVSLFTKLK